MNQDQSKNSVHTTSELDNEIILALSDQLENKADSLDSTTLARLSAARHRALEQQDHQKSGVFRNTVWKSGFAAAAIGFLALTIWFTGIREINTEKLYSAEADMLSELPILASEDSVEFYRSLEFLIWLENESKNNG